MVNKKNDDLSDSDRAELDALLSEREFQRRLRELRKARFDSIKVWANWIVAVALVGSMLKGWVAWAISQAKEWWGQ